MTTVHIYNAFIDPNEPTGGNPASVILKADDLSSKDKEKLVATSKTNDVVFVFKPSLERANFRFECFTGGKEIPISGHAIISAFSCMKEEGLIEDGSYAAELRNGHIVYVSCENDQVYLEQEHPVYEEPSMVDITSVLMAANVGMADLIPDTMPMLVQASSRSFIVGVKNLDVLKNLKPNLDQLLAISKEVDVIGFLFYTPETINEENDFSIRVFAPAYGINEDSASGTLAGALGCYVYDLHEAEKDTFHIEQGHFMEPKSPCFMTVCMETEDRKFLGPRVGGFAKKQK